MDVVNGMKYCSKLHISRNGERSPAELHQNSGKKPMTDMIEVIDGYMDASIEMHESMRITGMIVCLS